MSNAKVKKAERQAPFKCLRCLSRFDTCNWWCADGKKHVVDSKTYFLPDEPVNCGLNSEGQVIKRSRVLITNCPPPDPQALANLPAGGDDSNLGAGEVEFINGRFSCTDPEKIWWLDFRGGFCSEAEWQQTWLSEHENREIELEAMAAECRHLEEEISRLKTQVVSRESAAER